MSKDNRYSHTRKGRENYKLSFEWILNLNIRSSVLATFVIVHFCKYYYNLSFQRVCVFQRTAAKSETFLTQNEITIKYDRF